MDPRTPVIVGVGQVRNKRERIVEPIDLMQEAAARADADAGGGVLGRVGSVQVVNVLGRYFSDAPGELAARLGLRDGERIYTAVGGNTPQWLLARACDQIAGGEADVILLAGAEAQDSARQAATKGIKLDRGDRNEAPKTPVVGDNRTAMGPVEIANGLVQPPVVYPLYESALAAEAGRTLEEQRRWLAGLMAPFTKVAASHPDMAWFPQERSADEIASVGPDNRYIAEPYPKLLNAIMQVDQGGAILLCSAEAAEAAGVSRDRWVFPWASAECADVFITAQRPDMTRSPAIAAAGRAAFAAAGVTIDDVASIDLYSCFPSAVQMGAAALGIALDDPRGLTMTGGLPYFGGAGNNYVAHSIAYTVQRCRENPADIGLVTGLGWYITKHAIGLYSATPPPNGWQHADMSEEQERIDATALDIATDDEGTAVVEAFTVQHDRDAGPVHAPVFARLDDGRRAVASTADADLPRQLSGTNLVGQKIRVQPSAGKLVYEPV